MPNEIPSKDVLKAQITLLNDELHRVATVGLDYGQPFQNTDGEEVTLPSDVSFPAFWNHYLCGATIGQVNSLIDEAKYKNTTADVMVIKSYQGKAIDLLNHWIEDPNHIKTIQELETCKAAQTACQAFQWSDNYPLYQQLVDAMLKVGNTYSMLISGKRLIGFD